jgi:hypothetical protein
MNGLKLFLAVALVAAFAGCSGGGGKTAGGEATFDSCVKEYTDYTTKKSQGKMPAEAIKSAAETSCEPCKTNKDACKTVIEALKKAP